MYFDCKSYIWYHKQELNNIKSRLKIRNILNILKNFKIIYINIQKNDFSYSLILNCCYIQTATTHNVQVEYLKNRFRKQTEKFVKISIKLYFPTINNLILRQMK